MRYNGRQLSGPRTEVVPILRTDEEGGNIYFTVKGITDFAPFEALCLQPQPPQDILPGGAKRANVENPVYKDLLNRWWTKRSAWMAVTSLRDSPGVAWDKVKFDDPETWTEWQDELKEAGFVDAEIGRILVAIMKVNGLNENLVEEARKSFLIGQAAAANGQSSQPAVPPTTPSGAPASV